MTVLVAGYSGLVGSAIYETLVANGEDVVGISSKEIDLRNRAKAFEYLQDLKPDVVIDAAAKVGGIGANSSEPVKFLSDNLQIQSNLMDASHAANVERLVFLGSSCIYPKDAPQPIREDYLLTGPLEPTNSAYAVAKIAGIEQIKSYRKQFKRRWISLMPTNMYGPKDNFDIESGHVLPALVNRFASAVNNGSTQVTLWGSGTPKREFLYSSDLADAVIVALDKYDDNLHLNIGTGKDLAIAELAKLIAEECGFSGEIHWDRSKPDGTMRKVLDISRINALGWKAKIELRTGIKSVISSFKAQRGMV